MSKPTLESLPLEVLIMVIKAAVEDSIILNDEFGRRRILKSLSLVSKAFTLPSQRLLWSYLDYKVTNGAKLRKLIDQGLAKDFIIERLEFTHVPTSKNYTFSKLVNILEGVKLVKRLNLRNFTSLDQSLTPALFLVPSLHRKFPPSSFLFPLTPIDTHTLFFFVELSALSLTFVLLHQTDIILPSTLTELDIDLSSLCCKTNSMIPILLDSQSIITDLKINNGSERFSKYYEPSLKLDLALYLQRKGPQIQRLTFSIFDPVLISFILPFTPNLISLTIQQFFGSPRVTLLDIINTVSLLPNVARLEHLQIGEFELTKAYPPKFPLTLLLQLPSLSKLKTLRYNTNPSSYEYVWKKNEKGEPIVVERIVPKLMKSVEECKARGIDLRFRSEEQDAIAEINRLSGYV